MRVTPEKTDHPVQCVHGDAVAICVLLGDGIIGRMGTSFSLPILRSASRTLSPFNRELMFIIDVLIRAAAASAEIWALWRDAIRRTLFNFDQLCFGELLLFPDDFGGNHLALNGVRNKNGFALFPSDTLSAERDVLNS